MEVLKGYGSSGEESEPKTSLTLKDPLSNLELVDVLAEQRKQEITESINIKHEEQSSKKRTLNAVIETQYYDKSNFEINRRAYLISQRKNNSNKRKKLQKSQWEAPSSDDDFTTTDNGTDDELVPNPVSAIINDSPIEVTKFYGQNETDYQGRTYMHIPRDLNINLIKEAGSQECFIPKKLSHTWDGHIGGVKRLQFFPGSGHLLLSGGNDSNINLYDVYHNKELLRGYFGHKKPIKDLDFSKNSAGKSFASCAFDKVINIWDTETGKIISNFETKIGNPNTIKFIPNNDNELLVGLTDNKIEHYDLRVATTSSDHIVQTYDHHLDAISSLSFIDNNKKFVSTSDDRSIRIWELGINIPIKHIADPSQYSMPFIHTYPAGNYFATQAMDNKILVYQTVGKYRQNKKKVFKGHDVSGHGIDFGFSPDGKIVMSGGFSGTAYFWDWKTTKLLKTLKIDNQMISCIESHPQEVSKVAMAGSSGKIFCWE